jgi:uncharacterized protein (TIGR00297 family)
MALAVTGIFALLGWAVAGVTVGGAIAGFVVAFLLCYGIGTGAFVVLFAVFAITWSTTRLGRVRKQRLGIAEHRRGRRSAGQVLANIGVSGACAAAVLIDRWAPHHVPIVHVVGVTAAIAALAEAAADTSSSECGEAFSDTAFLIPNFRRVPAGTDGAVTAAGTISGVVAAGAVAAVSAALHVLPTVLAILAGAAGVVGMAVDTILGATLERSGRMNNNAVNFASTLAAALLAMAVLVTLRWRL